MGLKTGIQWTDATWNPMTGCTKISKGCDHCYAFTLAQTKVRDAYLRGIPVKGYGGQSSGPLRSEILGSSARPAASLA